MSRPSISVLLTGIANAVGEIVTPDTGQTKCYDSAGTTINCSGTGQDGELIAGATWPVSRFTVNADHSVSDTMTNLTWVQDGNLPGPAACVPTVAKNWLATQSYINCLNTNYYLGKSDWRMPNINELRSLINYGMTKQSSGLNSSGFTGIKDLDYWSSTTSASSPASAWTVSMAGGGIANVVGKSSTGYLLALRGGAKTVSPLPEITIFTATPQSGSLTATLNIAAGVNFDIIGWCVSEGIDPVSCTWYDLVTVK